MKYTLPKPFRHRVKQTVVQAMNLRIYLIQTERSRNNMTIDHCKKILQDMEVLRSDYQLAKFLLDNYTLIERAMPGPHEKSKIKLKELQAEASKYL